MIKTGFYDLDEIIKGYKDELIMVYGEPATGKTTLVLMTIFEQAKRGEKILFLDTEEGFSVDRYNQISQSIESLKNVIKISIKNFDMQDKIINDLDKFCKEFSLIIIDSFGKHYRKELSKKQYEINKKVDYQLRKLKQVIWDNKIPIIITNQVYDNMKGEKIAVGGEMLKRWCECIIELKKEPRRLLIKKPMQEGFEFEIKDKGLVKC